MSLVADPQNTKEMIRKGRCVEEQVWGILCCKGVDDKVTGLRMCQGSRAFSKASETPGKFERPFDAR